MSSDITINTKLYKQIFEETTNIHDDTVSTIDHVFGSPPLRLVDSHSKMLRFNSATPILWDTTKPNIDKYRVELILDLGFLSSKDNEYLLYNPREYYCLSETRDVNFNKQREQLKGIMKHPFLNTISSSDKQKYLNRVDKLINIYSKLLHRKANCSDFYIKLLSEIYKLIGFVDLSSFISNKMISQYNSGLIDKYIPEMIAITKNDVFGFLNLLDKGSFFTPPYFRSIKPNIYGVDKFDKNEVIKNIDLIIKLLQKKVILPHHSIYFWAWGLSGINHFGNDYGDFAQIEDTLLNLNIKNNISKLQLTLPKQDGLNFAFFKNTCTFSSKKTLSTTKFNVSNTKPSRASNICSIYLNSGDHFIEYWNDYKNYKKISELDMKNIV